MKKNVFLLASVFAAAMLAVSCGTQAEPTYRADGATPAECYSATLTPDSNAAATSYARGKKVRHLVMPPKSRPFIAHDLLARSLSPVRIACGDTVYRIVNADEVYSLGIVYDSKCTPDYRVLLRDYMAHSGLSSDTATEAALALRIADTAAYRASIAPLVRSAGVNIRFAPDGQWMYYTPVPDDDTRQPMHTFEIVSALRYYWGINVVPDPSIDLLELLSTGTDFATPGLDEAQVGEMLMRKFGMRLDDTGREVTTVSIRID